MTLVLCSSCNRHIFHPESGGDDACPFCATPVLVARIDSTTAVATGSRVGATVVAALVTLSAVQGCASESMAQLHYGLPDDEGFEQEDSSTADAADTDSTDDGRSDSVEDAIADGSAADAEVDVDAVTDGSSNGSGDSDE